MFVNSITMPQSRNRGFIVVECQTAPNGNNKRVCVPKSWIECELKDNKVAIAYPAEDETRIATRIKNNEAANAAWALHIGVIKYEAESYEDAVIGFLTNGEQSKQNEKKSSNVQRDTKSKDSLKPRTVVPKGKQKSDNKKKPIKKHLIEQSKNKIHISKHRNVKNVAKKVTSSDSVDSGVTSEVCNHCGLRQDNAESPGKSLESRIEDLIIDSFKHINSNNTTDTSGRIVPEHLDIELDKEINLTNPNVTPKDRRTLLTLAVDQKDKLGYIKAILVSLKEVYSKLIENKKSVDSIISKYKDVPSVTMTKKESKQNGKPIEDDNSQSDDMEPLWFDDEMESDDVEKQENDNTLLNVKQNQKIEDTDTEMDDDSDFETFNDDEESTSDSLLTVKSSAPKVKVTKAKIHEDSTWTLKHANPGKGLERLGGKKDKVYISTEKLEKIKQMATDVKMFTRLLTREVFTPDALACCSMYGRRTYCGKKNREVSPALHPKAVKLIIDYSMRYGKEVGWADFQRKDLVQSLRTLLYNARRAETDIHSTRKSKM